MFCFVALLLFATSPVQQESDSEAIAAHVDAIFSAFIAKDRIGVQERHTQDWLGFQSRSLSIVRGIEGYMSNAEAALADGRGSRHEMLEIVPRVYEDIAVAPYVARYFIGTGEEAQTILYRAIDIYRREGGRWNQCGTNICVLPDNSIGYPSAAAFEAFPRLRPLAVDDPPEPSANALESWVNRRPSEADQALLRQAALLALTSVGNAEALSELRTDDWVGFELTSTKVVVRDGAVIPATDEWTARVAGGAIIEFEAQIYGETALVFALLRATEANGGSFLVRAAEVYRRVDDGWLQCASHANPVPDVLR